MNQSGDDKAALATILEALKVLGKWSHQIRDIADAKAYLLQAFPGHHESHKAQQLALLREIVRVAEMGRTASVVELIKQMSTPQSPERLDPEDTDAGIHASFRRTRGR
jgi:hypothetical protein